MQRHRFNGRARVACSGAALALATFAGLPVQADTTRNQTPVWGPDVFGGYASTHVIVRVAPGVAVPEGANVRFGDAKVDQALAAFNALEVRKVFDVPFGNPERAARIGLDRYYKIMVPAGSNTPALALTLGMYKNIFESAEIDGIGGTADTIPNDVGFSQCWGQHNTGQNVPCAGVGLVDADIDCPQAWDIFTGDDSITVAVIDSGVWSHVDLQGNLLTGWNTVTNSTDVSDTCNHGTHCSGTVGARGNNTEGVAGVSWRCKILPVKVLTGCGGTSSDCAEGIIWAADNGAHIGTMSLQYYDYAQVHRDSCEYAHGEGTLLIAANGNGQGRRVAAPAAFPFCMGISATNNQDVRAGFSNYGPECDVSAPGENVYSLSQTNQYQCLSGTSMATPHTAGLAALIWSYAPGMTNDDVERVLKETTEDRGPAGWDEEYGWGRINAFNAIQAADPGVSVNLLSASPTLLPPGVPHEFQVRIRSGNDVIVPGSQLLHYRYDANDPFQTAPLVLSRGDIYMATVPAPDCGTEPEWYVSATGQTGGLKTFPRTAPAQTLAADVGVIEDEDLLFVDFNAGIPAGWTKTGLWTTSTGCSPAGVSCNGGSFAYYGNTTVCTYATGGRTFGTLASPDITLPDLPYGGDLTLSFCTGLRTENTPGFDTAEVYFANTLVDTIPNLANWTVRTIDLTPFAGQTGKLEFRFDSQDGGMNNFRGWTVDGVKIHKYAAYCVNPNGCYADCDQGTGTGVLDIFDFLCFQNKFAASDPYACDCDTSTGGNVCDIFDFICFQNAFAAGCP